MRNVLSMTVVATLLCGACSEPVLPSRPSSLGFENRSDDTTPSPAIGLQRAVSLGAVQSVPFKGSFEGSQTLTPTQPGWGVVNGVASGNGTHLGAFTVAFPHTVNFATRSGQGTYTFTAANGDTLTADFTGQAQGGPVVLIAEHATVTGGSGRFAAATGSFVAERRFDPATGTTEGTFTGTIALAPH